VGEPSLLAIFIKQSEAIPVCPQPQSPQHCRLPDWPGNPSSAAEPDPVFAFIAAQAAIAEYLRLVNIRGKIPFADKA
jgi:hypothetical protein